MTANLPDEFLMFWANMAAAKEQINPRACLYLSVPLQGLRGWKLSQHAPLEKKGSRSALELRARNSGAPRVTCPTRSRFHVYIPIFSLGREQLSLQLQTKANKGPRFRVPASVPII